jgi:hypothetical protein
MVAAPETRPPVVRMPKAEWWLALTPKQAPRMTQCPSVRARARTDPYEERLRRGALRRRRRHRRVLLRDFKLCWLSEGDVQGREGLMAHHDLRVQQSLGHVVVGRMRILGCRCSQEEATVPWRLAEVCCYTRGAPRVSAPPCCVGGGASEEPVREAANDLAEPVRPQPAEEEAQPATRGRHQQGGPRAEPLAERRTPDAPETSRLPKHLPRSRRCYSAWLLLAEVGVRDGRDVLVVAGLAEVRGRRRSGQRLGRGRGVWVARWRARDDRWCGRWQHNRSQRHLRSWCRCKRR